MLILNMHVEQPFNSLSETTAPDTRTRTRMPFWPAVPAARARGLPPCLHHRTALQPQDVSGPIAALLPSRCEERREVFFAVHLGGKPPDSSLCFREAVRVVSLCPPTSHAARRNSKLATRLRIRLSLARCIPLTACGAPITSHHVALVAGVDGGTRRVRYAPDRCQPLPRHPGRAPREDDRLRTRVAARRGDATQVWQPRLTVGLQPARPLPLV